MTTCASPEIKPLSIQGTSLPNGTNGNADVEVEVDIDADPAESDYGSDFTPDEVELLNTILVEVAGDNSTTSQVTAAAAAAAAGGLGEEEEGGERGKKLLTPPPVAVGDIEDYERVWKGTDGSSYGPRVLGRVVVQQGQEGRGGEVQQQQQQQQWASTAARKRPGSFQARFKARGRGAAMSGLEDTGVQDARTPIERFRRPPMKVLSVTDLVSPAWCELQYWYSLTKYGKQRRTAAMKKGSAIHKKLEDQVHTTVPVEVTTKEEGWAIRIWNVIQGLRTLRETGMTRELEIWGMIDGEIVCGIIDQLSYECPDPEMEASAEEYYANATAARQALPEYQTSVTDYLLSPSRKKGRKVSDLAQSDQPREPHTPNPSQQRPSTERKIYMTDTKTRGIDRSIPTVSSASFRPTHLQLHIYFHLLNRLITTDEITIEKLASRYDLDPNRTFSETFIAEVGGLNDQFYDVLTSQGSSGDSSTNSNRPPSPSSLHDESSQDSTSILLSHNNLSDLWSLMKTHLYLTFLPENSPPPTSQPAQPAPKPQTKSHPKSQPKPKPQPFKPPSLLSPLLTATYKTPTTPSENLGSRSFLFDPAVLISHLRDEMSWWFGKRQTRGVDVTEAWKCGLCEFRKECTWRVEREQEMAESKRVKREALAGGG